ncbi:ABC transporter permease [Bifidobacterium callimiconis]|uniref:ABC transporter permease n=1 Tax=Bifidobacterium callimiconis TaxID=2306973 RepID=UPI001BDC23A8|nr:ABC transporter permease [Bifidobacterium callimiconis]MBT1178020.1 ABC transporter permease [Bifidobacterium callimiconis]
MTSKSRYRFIVTRLLTLIPLILGILLVTTLLLDLTPGDPARLVTGPRASDNDVARVRSQMGLDKPFLIRYIDYVFNVVRGDFGTSFKTGKAVGAQITQQLPITLSIAVGGIVVALLLSVVLAMLSVQKPDGVADQIVRILCVVGIGLPSFWIAIMLISYVALPTRAFPVAGIGTDMVTHVRAMILPILTVAISLTAPMTRSLRATLLDVRNSDYVLAARTLGFKGWGLTGGFILRNAAGPLVVVAASQAGYALFGTTVVEVAFSLPGIGQGLVTAASQRDFPLVQGYTFVFAIAIVVIYLIADVITSLIDPRVRIES